MCKYCDNLTKDFFDENNTLDEDLTLDFGVFGRVDIGLGLHLTDSGDPVLCNYIIGQVSPVDEEKNYKINYCPMCGKKL